MKKVLLVWQRIPEETSFYIIDCNDEEVQLLESVSNEFLGGTEDEEIESNLLLISDALSPTKEYCQNQEWATKWASYEISLPYNPNEKIDLIINCGVFL